MAEFNINQLGEDLNSSSTGSAMTLREAIILTNNSGEDDVINLAESTYTLSLEGRYENEALRGRGRYGE